MYPPEDGTYTDVWTLTSKVVSYRDTYQTLKEDP